jgi:hypothetical protein
VSAFDLASALKTSGRQEQIHDWVQAYLRTPGHWINLGLADGLLHAPRWWLGPFQAPIETLFRKCGPEPEMEFRMPLDSWNTRIEKMSSAITDIEQLPPLIVERRGDRWVIADGTHRHETLRRLGHKTCWTFAWFNSEDEYNTVRDSI